VVDQVPQSLFAFGDVAFRLGADRVEPVERASREEHQDERNRHGRYSQQRGGKRLFIERRVRTDHHEQADAGYGERAEEELPHHKPAGK